MIERLIPSRLPLVAAPMAGGPSAVNLARAVAAAGAFPFLAGGYKTPASLEAEIEELRESVSDFGVNLFVPSHNPLDETAFSTYARLLADEAATYHLKLDQVPVADDDDYWEEKLTLLVEHPASVVSLTFGLPDPTDIARLQQVGTRVLVSVTTPEEAAQAAETGVDGLVIQGPRAGGHSATFTPSRKINDLSTVELVRAVRSVVNLPVIAAGGVDGPRAVRELLDADAEAVAIGTLLLLADEAGTSQTHRRALCDPQLTETVLTRAFTGRPARALRNGFIIRHQNTAINAYPAVHHLTRALRQAAGRAGDADRLHLWAGTGWRNARAEPVADIIASLSTQINER